MKNYEYTNNALIIKKEIGDLKIIVAAELPKDISAEDALDAVLDVVLEMADKMPADNNN